MIEIHSICIHVECLTPLHTENGTKNEEEYERKKAAFISSAELEYGKNITFSIDVLTDILYFHARNIHSDYEPHNYMQAQYHKWKKKGFRWMDDTIIYCSGPSTSIIIININIKARAKRKSRMRCQN